MASDRDFSSWQYKPTMSEISELIQGTTLTNNTEINEEVINEIKRKLSIAINNMVAAKFQIENLGNSNISYEVRIELINRFLDSTLEIIQNFPRIT
ncbi:MAG: hypothetical protein HCA25_19530 [Dolichospermum sp. DET50]|nr:hypothetical protein [Dolichospermum sp. DET66]MBS3034389.1 hypothetical protein [Dolichospermum sp. DET67]MBS3039592.1 hypothetical protein [Dolichospermum sp. DET50]MDK2408425.1 hypothetical protein [Aphanizomenon sp. 202]MDK2459201.1 hypothetical protein [Aphanizomenon sp. PH219]QSX66802.1 MAG: hypothetical protein EZY12_18800 [Dolichospermum sp. DET69]